MDVGADVGADAGSAAVSEPAPEPVPRGAAASNVTESCNCYACKKASPAVARVCGTRSTQATRAGTVPLVAASSRNISVTRAYEISGHQMISPALAARR